MKDIEILKNEGIDVDAALEILGDMDMYNDTLKDFLDEVNNRVEQMQAYKDNGDMENYAILAHSMKSDSKYLGFVKLAELSYNHELKGKEKDINYINSNYDTLITEVKRVVKAVNNYLNG